MFGICSVTEILFLWSFAFVSFWIQVTNYFENKKTGDFIFLAVLLQGFITQRSSPHFDQFKVFLVCTAPFGGFFVYNFGLFHCYTNLFIALVQFPAMKDIFFSPEGKSLVRPVLRSIPEKLNVKSSLFAVAGVYLVVTIYSHILKTVFRFDSHKYIFFYINLFLIF